MKLFKRLILSVGILVALVVALPTSTLAAPWSPFGSSGCSSKNNSTTDSPGNSVVCKDGKNTKNPFTGPNGLIMRITDVVALLAGVAGVIMVVLAGLRFVTAGGSSEDIAGARRTITYAIVGLIIVALSRTLVAFTLGRI